MSTATIATTALPTQGEGKIEAIVINCMLIQLIVSCVDGDTRQQVLIILGLTTAVMITLTISLIFILYSTYAMWRHNTSPQHNTVFIGTQERGTGTSLHTIYNVALIDTIRTTKCENVYV